MISRIKKELKNFEGLSGFKYSAKHWSFLSEDDDRTLIVFVGEVISSGLDKKITGGVGSVDQYA